MSKAANQNTHSAKLKVSLPKSASSLTEQAVNTLLEIMTQEETSELDFSGTTKYAYPVADRIKAAELILKYAPEKQSEIPSDIL